MNSGIYRITNLVTKKIYIGSSKNLKHRFYIHKYRLRKGNHSNPHLQSAWNLYGEDSFLFEVLEGLDEGLRERKQTIIEQTKCLDRTIGYNIALTTDCPMDGRNHSEESIEKMREAKTGENNNFYGKNHTEETKRKLREQKLGIPLDPEHKEKVLKTAWKKGGDHINAKLNDEIVYEIKKEYKTLDNKQKRGYTNRKAKELNVNWSTINRILKNETWTHITLEEK